MSRSVSISEVLLVHSHTAAGAAAAGSGDIDSVVEDTVCGSIIGARGSHVSTAGGLLAVILRFDGECAAPFSIDRLIHTSDHYLLL